MKKSVYTVYINSMFVAKYVTTTRNAEDMINQLKSMYHRDETDTIKIYRKTEGEEKILIYRKNYKRSCK